MKRMIRSLLASALASALLPSEAWGAGCATQSDIAALKVAALQQELMVAAFSCHDIARYNDFVLAHQPELIASDANLKTFFQRRDGRRSDAGYHTYKTELANAASLSSLRDGAFCDRAAEEFDASADRDGLSAFVGAREWTATAVYPACPGVATSLRTASVAPRRETWRLRQVELYDGDPGVAAAPQDAIADDDRPGGDSARNGNSVYDLPRPHRSIDGD